MSDNITMTLRLKIVKPLFGDWDRLGLILRALRAPLHRVLNGVVRELEAPHYEREEWWEDKSDPSLIANPMTASYRITGTLWDKEREDAAARVDKGKPYTLDRAIVEHTPTSHVQLGVAGKALASWKKFDKERWKGLVSLPSFKHDSPIYVVGQGVDLQADNGNAVLSVHLLKDWERLAVTVDGGSAHHLLRQILSGEAKLGDARILQDNGRDGKPKWFAMVSLTMPAREQSGGRTMAIHRGVKSFLTCAISRSAESVKDAFTTIVETGDDVLRHKAAYTARRRSLGKQGRQLGAGARGHGVDRRHERITKLEDAEARWVRTKCQEVAAHVCRLAERFNATTIILEDWSNPAKNGAPELGERVEYLVRSFPMAALKEAVRWAAKKHGLTVDEQETNHNSRDCPACGHRHEQAQIGTFMCSSCKLERPSDVIFAWNMLRRAGYAPGIAEANEASKRAARKLKGEA